MYATYLFLFLAFCRFSFLSTAPSKYDETTDITSSQEKYFRELFKELENLTTNIMFKLKGEERFKAFLEYLKDNKTNLKELLGKEGEEVENEKIIKSKTKSSSNNGPDFSVKYQIRPLKNDLFENFYDYYR